MKNTHLLMAVVAAVTLGAMSTTAPAETQSGMAGHGWPNHFDTCFGSSWAMMVNNCGGTVESTRGLVIPIQAPGPGPYHYVYARAGGNGSNGRTSCQALALAWHGGSYSGSFSAMVSTSFSAATQHLNLGTVYAFYDSTVHFECNLAQGGGRVVNVEFN